MLRGERRGCIPEGLARFTTARGVGFADDDVVEVAAAAAEGARLRLRDPPPIISRACFFLIINSGNLKRRCRYAQGRC